MNEQRELLSNVNVAVRRAFSTIKNELHDRKATFLLGAGVDILIARDFCPPNLSLPPGWTELLRQLPPFSSLGATGGCQLNRITQIAKTWPVEAASLARWWTGDNDFSNRIKEKLDPTAEISKSIYDGIRAIRKGAPENPTSLLCKLLVKSNLIVTSNFSKYVEEALRAYCEVRDGETTSTPNLIVLDREDLQSFPFPEAENTSPIEAQNKTRREIFLVHLHGRCSDRSFPILDSWGYNTVGEDSESYVSFLRELFTRRTVISVGVSWADPPLRTASAFVQRTRAYVNRSHLAIYFQSDNKSFGDEEERSSSTGIGRLWGTAMRGAYGVNVLFVGPETQPKWFEALNGRDSKATVRDEPASSIRALVENLTASKADISDDGLKPLAEFLDACGDYESPLQHELLKQLGTKLCPPDATRKAIFNQACKRLEEIISGYVGALENDNPEKWTIAARIERHFRHHFYLYQFERNDVRKTHWLQLAKKIPGKQSWRSWDKISEKMKREYLFDFLVGQYELQTVDDKFQDYCNSLAESNERFEIASTVWHPRRKEVRDGASKRTASSDEVWQEVGILETAGARALSVGWESLAAKAFTDRAQLLAMAASTLRLTVESRGKEITNQAEQASSLSRSGGCFRRQVKADSIAAMWNPDPAIARIKLLANIRAAEISQSVEPGLMGGLGAALLVCELRMRMRSNNISRTHLGGIAKNLFAEAGLDESYMDDALKYWPPLAPPAVSELLEALKQQRSRATGAL